MPILIPIRSRLGSSSRRSPLLRPGEVQHRHHEETVAAVGNTSKSIVPCQEGPQECHKPTGLLQLRVRHALLVAQEVGDTEEEDGEVDEEKESEECKG